MSKRFVALILLVSMVFAVSATAGAQAVRRGAWVDEVVFVEEPDISKGITRLEAGDIQVFAQTISNPEQYGRVLAAPNLDAYPSFGLYTELTFNPITKFTDGRLNPWGVARIREAMNWLVDRDYIVSEHHGGLAKPRYFAINSVFPDYARVADIARVLERKYAHDPARAKKVIDEEMVKLGASLSGGKWMYQGKPVECVFLIRTEDERRLIGDYVAGLLEGLGFTVERRYVTAAQAGPIWMTGDPNEGKWNICTGGWSTTVIARDQGGNFDFFYTSRGRSDTLWVNYKVDPEFDQLSNRLARSDFKTIAERNELYAKVLELSMKDSVRVWLVERLSYFPKHKNITMAADLAGGVSGAWLWGHTIKDHNKVGASLRIALPSMLTNPWNPVAGSNWLFDMMLIRGCRDHLVYPNPYTGLHMPQRLDRAEVHMKKGLPVTKTSDWVSLTFHDEIKVPTDAYIDWNAKTQKWITVGEKFPAGLTANKKVVFHYPRDLYQIKWHDGSRFSAADIVMSMILPFDRANPDSAIYDSAAVPAFKSFQTHFKGWRIASRNPLVIEHYSDRYTLDAEVCVANEAMWPDYAQGPGPWHTIAIGVLTEAEGKLAFSSGKATANKVEWMNFVAGPSLQILRNHLPRVLREKYIPYAPTLGGFITSFEAWERWSNLTRWWAEKGHMWVANGPLYIEKVYPVEKTVVVRNYTGFHDPAGKWDLFGAPMLATVTVSGPARIVPGTAASFDVKVTTNGADYKIADIQEVKFLLFDAAGELALQGPATAVRDGLWRVSLTAAHTGALPIGTAEIEAVVVSKMVSIPAFGSLDVVIRR